MEQINSNRFVDITALNTCKTYDNGPKKKKGGIFVRKAMTNLDSILKSRDITLPAKVRLVKAMVFLVVMNGRESSICF